MASNVNPAVPADGESVNKAELRDNFQATKDEIEALQTGNVVAFTGANGVRLVDPGATGIDSQIELDPTQADVADVATTRLQAYEADDTPGMVPYTTIQTEISNAVTAGLAGALTNPMTVDLDMAGNAILNYRRTKETVARTLNAADAGAKFLISGTNQTYTIPGASLPVGFECDFLVLNGNGFLIASNGSFVTGDPYNHTAQVTIPGDQIDLTSVGNYAAIQVLSGGVVFVQAYTGRTAHYTGISQTRAIRRPEITSAANTLTLEYAANDPDKATHNFSTVAEAITTIDFVVPTEFNASDVEGIFDVRLKEGGGSLNWGTVAFTVNQGAVVKTWASGSAPTFPTGGLRQHMRFEVVGGEVIGHEVAVGY